MPKTAHKKSQGNSYSSSKNNNDITTTNNSGKKRKRQVQVVVCPSAFPDFATVGGSTSRRDQRERGIILPSKHTDPTSSGGVELDVQQTIREIHKFGATGFQGTQKKTHDKETYEWLTGGRTQKRQKIPTKILVGMRQKALKREERLKRELKESGVVSHHHQANNNNSNKSLSASAKARNKKRKEEEQPKAGPGFVQGVFGSNSRKNKKGNRRSMDAGSFGPAPDVGFMKKGVLRVKRR